MARTPERAFLVCQDADGNLKSGPVVTGDYTSVDMPTVCPPRTRPVAVVHTHPPASSIEPSEADLNETRLAGLKAVCVIHKSRVRCYAPDP